MTFCAGTAFMVGCATFHPRPLSPAETAAAFETRTLADIGLKAFLEKNLHHEITPWPPESWDLTMLTLAAFYNHPDLDVARARWEAAQAGVITAGERPNPDLGLSPQYDVDAASGVSPWTLGLNLDIPIETAGKRGYRIVRAKHLSEAARLEIATVAWQVRSRLRTALLNFQAADQTVPILNRQQAVQEEEVRLLEERLAVGEASQPDLIQAKIALNQTSLAALEAEKQASEAWVQLAQALGLPVGALDGIEIRFDPLDRLPDDLPSPDLRRQALLNRSDILGGLAEYAAAQSALQLEIARQYPDVHLGPGYTWDQEKNKWSIGLSVSLPILNRNEGPIAEAEARRKETAASFMALQARVIGETERALSGYLAAKKKTEAAEGLLSDRKEQLEIARAMFEAGEVDRLALLGARLEMESAALSRVDALIRAQQSLGLLEEAMQRPVDSSQPVPVTSESDPRAKEEYGK